jgi:hypothetical protein
MTDKLTQKTDFLIDTLEAFIDFPELKELILNSATEAAKQIGLAPIGDITWTDQDFWVVFIANFCVMWALRHNIGPNLFSTTISGAATIHYTEDIQRRISQATTEPRKSTADGELDS